MRFHKALRMAFRHGKKIRRDWWSEDLFLVPGKSTNYNDLDHRISVRANSDVGIDEFFRPTLDDIFNNDWEVV